MSIWFQPLSLERLNATLPDTLGAWIGIEFTAFGDDWLEASMPVVAHTRQPLGLLHGGASAALAETVGSVAANCCIDIATLTAVGQEISASHLRPALTGHVHGRATPLHVGRRSQVWQIAIRNDDGKPVCVSRLTMAVIARP